MFGFRAKTRDVAGEIARREVIGAVEEDIVIRYQLPCVLTREATFVQSYIHVWIRGSNSISCGVDFRASGVGRAVQNLSLQIR